MKNSNIIEIKNLTKKFKNLIAVDDISFTVKKNSMFAFLGTNGAGKSTTINIISTIMKKTTGSVFVNGNAIDRQDNLIKKDIGIVFQEGLLDPMLTVKENLYYRSSLYGLQKEIITKRINELSQRINFSDFLNQKYGTLSGGQKRKADIVRALINKPKILILDEPTTGLDPEARKNIWLTIKKLKDEEDITIFLTTHYMEEAAIADKIVVIAKGKIVAQGTPEALKKKYTSDIIKLYTTEDKKEELINVLKPKKLTITRDILELKTKSSSEALEIINSIKDYIYDFEVIKGNLDDAFININKKNKGGKK